MHIVIDDNGFSLFSDHYRVKSIAQQKPAQTTTNHARNLQNGFFFLRCLGLNMVYMAFENQMSWPRDDNMRRKKRNAGDKQRKWRKCSDFINHHAYYKHHRREMCEQKLNWQQRR